MVAARILSIGADIALQRVFEEAVAPIDGCLLERTDSLEAARLRLQQGGVQVILACLSGGGLADQSLSFVRDLRQSGVAAPLVVVSQSDDPEFRLQLLRLGALDCLAQPVNPLRLTSLFNRLATRPEPDPLPRARSAEAEACHSAGDFLVISPAMSELLEQFRAVAPLATTVLLTGQTGCGKTHVARLIHELSPRRRKPFVVVQCSSLSAPLIQSELFGHVKGAFTGAETHHGGLFAEAQDGTVLLDDIDCVPLEAQARLLRVVENRLYEPVGSTRSRPLAARLIVATNRVMEQEVAEGRFRADLYYRLNVVRFTLPPLCQRPAAIRPLAETFLQRYGAQAGRSGMQLSGEALLALEGYGWPGNVRELRNVIEGAVALCRRTIVELQDIPEPIRACYHAATLPTTPPVPPATSAAVDVANNSEVHRLQDALRRNGGNRARTAAELGISRVTLYRKLHRYHLI